MLRGIEQPASQPFENTGKAIEVVTADCERDNFMTAQEAVEYGLIDKVIEHR